MSGTGEPFDGAPPRPSPPKPPRESIVIDGQATHRARPQRPAALLFANARDRLVAGAAGGLVGALVVLVGARLVVPQPDFDSLAHRLDVLEAGATAAQARVDGLEAGAKVVASEGRARDARIAAMVAAAPSATAVAQGEARLTALEAGQGSAAEDRKAAIAKGQTLASALAAMKTDLVAAAGERKSLADEIARLQAAVSEAAALDRRVTELEGAALRADALAPIASEARAAHEAADRALAAAAKPASPQEAAETAGNARLIAALAAQDETIGALRSRFDKLESAMFAPKAETRAVAVAPIAADDADAPAERAIAALALEQRWRSGQPIADELETLDRLGVDTAALSALRPFAAGRAPTDAALAQAFAALRPQLVSALRPPPPESPVGRLFGEVQGLVKIRKLGESYGAEADAVASHIAAALARDDLDGALAAVRDLPPAGRDAAHPWTAAAEARREADRAAEALARRMVAGLGGR